MDIHLAGGRCWTVADLNAELWYVPGPCFHRCVKRSANITLVVCLDSGSSKMIWPCSVGIAGACTCFPSSRLLQLGNVLTLYVLNFAEGTLIYIYILCHYSTLIWHMYLVLRILPQVRPGPIYSSYSISWLLMSWRRQEAGHQQPRYWPSWTKITRSPS